MCSNKGAQCEFFEWSDGPASPHRQRSGGAGTHTTHTHAHAHTHTRANLPLHPRSRISPSSSLPLAAGATPSPQQQHPPPPSGAARVIHLTLHPSEGRFAAECPYSEDVLAVFRSPEMRACGATWDPLAKHVRGLRVACCVLRVACAHAVTPPLR